MDACRSNYAKKYQLRPVDPCELSGSGKTLLCESRAIERHEDSPKPEDSLGSCGDRGWPDNENRDSTFSNESVRDAAKPDASKSFSRVTAHYDQVDASSVRIADE
jgi:hypothetical protein